MTQGGFRNSNFLRGFLHRSYPCVRESATFILFLNELHAFEILPHEFNAYFWPQLCAPKPD